MGTQPHFLSVIIFLPLFSVAALLVLRSDDHTWIRRIALAASIAEFLISLLLLRGFEIGNAAFQIAKSTNGSARPFTTTWASTASACSSFC